MNQSSLRSLAVLSVFLALAIGVGVALLYGNVVKLVGRLTELLIGCTDIRNS